MERGRGRRGPCRLERSRGGRRALDHLRYLRGPERRRRRRHRGPRPRDHGAEGGGQPVTTLEFAEIVRAQYGSDLPPTVTGEYRFGDTRHILSDISALRGLGWEPRRTPADSVEAYAKWLAGLDGLEDVLARANARMRELGVVRKAGG